MKDDYKYPGDELALFQHAKRWKKYFSRQIRPFLKGNVLEAGAGIGSTTLFLNDGSALQWLMLEPDVQRHDALKEKIELNLFPPNCRLQTGTIEQVTSTFDTIIYIDVLEHIKADANEMKKAAGLLNVGGHIVILVPASQSLFSPFDKAIGHYRRYNKMMLRNITAPGTRLISCKYYDSIGWFASLINKMFLRQKIPTMTQVLFWDRWIVPVSTVTDKLFFHSFGKSIIAIWQK
ncbi:MAG TPA: methyltransferase domain-containing protein [Chitinophagaceae bacterium]|nr:methyltransferase domain-containing protein [Chitinophagaceae bacterium]